MLTDAELVALALSGSSYGFSKENVARLLRLAGDEQTAKDVEENGPEYLLLGRHTMEALVEKIRKRQKEMAT